MAGYSASSDAISGASKKISDDASNTQQSLSQNTQTTVAAGDFGQAHQQHQADYAAAMAEFGKGIGGMCSTLTNFAGLLSQNSTNYSSVESSNTATVSNAGGN